MILSAIIGAVVGAGLTVLVSRVVESSRHPVDTLATDIEAIEVDSALARALDLTTEAAVIVGPHDEVLHTLSLIHISEPTRQEAISYAVFCLKKKNERI